MRQGQQNRRGRGRTNNTNRGGGKGQNPLTRTVESNGPDVKIRGNPSHIAEKYITLARDSLSSGDIVMAENYLQHAEHYNRIIMSHREQQQLQQENQNNRNNNRSQQQQHNGGYSYNNNEPKVADGGDNQLSEENSVAIRGNEPQPHINEGREREPRENTRTRRNNNDNRADRQPRAARSRRVSEAQNGEQQPRNAAPTRRRNTNAGKSDGPKISDGQETPGFLKNSVAPAAKRKRRPPAAGEAQTNEPAETPAPSGEET